MIRINQRKALLKKLRRLMPSSVVCLCCRKVNTKSERKKFMKKKVLCTALAVTMLLTTTASATAKPWWLSKYRVTFDNELGIVGNVTLQFASDGGSFIRPITKDTARASASKVMSRQNTDIHPVLTRVKPFKTA